MNEDRGAQALCLAPYESPSSPIREPLNFSQGKTPPLAAPLAKTYPLNLISVNR